MERNLNLTQLRPSIPQAKVNATMTDKEQFQNSVLRPILKFQNDMLVAHISSIARNQHKDWGSISNEKKLIAVNTYLSKNQNIRNVIIGITIGLLTTEEHQYYLKNKTEINKRIIQMTKERIGSNLAIL